MSLEIACTACGAELEVESGGAITQCPACGIDLEIPDFEEPAVGDAVLTSVDAAAFPKEVAEPTLPNASPDTALPSTEVANFPPADVEFGFVKSPIHGADEDPASDFSAFEAFQSRPGQIHDDALPTEFGANLLPNTESAIGDSLSGGTIEPNLLAANTTTNNIVGVDTSGETESSPESVATAAATAVSAGTSVSTATDTPLSRGAATSTVAAADSELAKLKSRNKLLLSYASAVTIAALWMAYMLYTSAFAKYRLESLPDLAPPVDRNGKLSTLIYVPSTARLPPLHELRIGESRQFGVVRVTPLRVTRGPLQFVRYDGNNAEKRDPSSETLQLHLRLENTSRDQVVTPLDSALVYARQADSKRVGRMLANQFIQVWQASPAATNPSVDPVVLYDLPIGSIWDIAGQNLGRALEPGEAVETFVASSEERLDELQGDLQWRLHFRKGHNPNSGRGVTTLVDIRFQAREIQPSG